MSVDFDGESVTGLVQELKVKLATNSTTLAPVVQDFKLTILGATTARPVKKGLTNSVVVTAPETVVTAIGGADYVENLKTSPAVLSGHTEAETSGGTVLDLGPLADGSNGQLTERKGPCDVSDLPDQPARSASARSAARWRRR